jgi:hypothetical protein
MEWQLVGSLCWRCALCCGPCTHQSVAPITSRVYLHRQDAANKQCRALVSMEIQPPAWAKARLCSAKSCQQPMLFNCCFAHPFCSPSAPTGARSGGTHV